jgi:putative inorganic carbon (HCO3(-)) transporter
VTSDELLPIAGLVAALGVALLLVERSAILRIAGIAAVIAGSVPLIDAQAPGLSHALDRSPVLVGAAGIGAVGAFVVGTAAALRWPWVVPVAGLVIALRFPLSNPIRPAHFLLPLYGVLACGLAALVWTTVRRRGTAPELGYVGFALAGYVVFAAVSLEWTFDLDRGVFAMAATYVPLGVLASLTARAARTRPFLVAMPIVQVALATVLAVVAIWEWFAKTTIVENAKIDIANAYSNLFRVNSLLFDPSLFGRVEVFALLTITGLCVFGARRAAVVAAAAVAPVIFLGMAFSFSQTSFMALAAGVWMIALLAWRRAVAIGAGLAVIVVAVGLAASQPQVEKAFHQSVDRASSSRTGLAERGSETFGSHPVAGVGLGGFGAATGKTLQEKRRIAPHNIVVDVASELGIVGLALFMTLLGTIAVALRRVPNAALRAILAADLVALLVHGLGYDQFFSDPTFWGIAAIAGACAVRTVTEAAPEVTAAIPPATTPAAVAP